MASKPFDPFIVGADIGNATTSIHARPGDRFAFLPSFVAGAGIGKYDGISKLQTDRHHISYDGRNALVGVEAVEGNGGDSILGAFAPGDEWKRYINRASMFCLLAGVSSAFVDADTVGVTLATGAPLSIYQAYGDAIRKRYMGEHKYSYNGHARRLLVADVKVYGEGREVLRLIPTDERKGRIVVHDVGGRTWNVLFFQNGAPKGNGRTFEHGIERLFDRMPGLVDQSAGGRWAIQQELRSKPKAQPKIRAELESQVKDVLELIDSKIESIGKADRHLIIGGGAFFVADAIARHYGSPTSILNGEAPERANAVAYALAASEVA